MKKSVLEYKGYYTNIQFDSEDMILFGKIEMISDTVGFEAESISEIEQSFHDAVDEYLDLCERIDKEPQKPYKGSFNVRISPELHRAAAIEAIKSDQSLNQFVQSAIEEKLNYDENDIKPTIKETEENIIDAISVVNQNLWLTTSFNMKSKSVEEKK